MKLKMLLVHYRLNLRLAKTSYRRSFKNYKYSNVLTRVREVNILVDKKIKCLKYIFIFIPSVYLIICNFLTCSNDSYFLYSYSF